MVPQNHQLHYLVTWEILWHSASASRATSLPSCSSLAVLKSVHLCFSYTRCSRRIAFCCPSSCLCLFSLGLGSSGQRIHLTLELVSYKKKKKKKPTLSCHLLSPLLIFLLELVSTLKKWGMWGKNKYTRDTSGWLSPLFSSSTTMQLLKTGQSAPGGIFLDFPCLWTWTLSSSYRGSMLFFSLCSLTWEELILGSGFQFLLVW